MYAIGSIYKANKETIDGVQKTVDAHKQLLRVIKDFAVSAGWTVIDYKEDFESGMSPIEADLTSSNVDDIEQRQLIIENPSKDLYINFITGASHTDDAFNIGVWLSPGFDPEKATTSQDYQICRTWLAANDSLEYFLTIDNDTLVGFLFANNQYSSHLYCGRIEQFEDRTKYPFACILATNDTAEAFERAKPIASGNNYPYYMDDLSGGALRYNNDDKTDDLNFTKNISEHTGLCKPDMSYGKWCCITPGYDNYPTNGDYFIGELYVKAGYTSGIMSDNAFGISVYCFAGKIKNVYKISGYNLYTKYVVQVGGTPITNSNSDALSVKGYVDAVIQSGGRAFVVANDLSNIKNQSYVCIEMK